jgi:hypothetical protein
MGLYLALAPLVIDFSVGAIPCWYLQGVRGTSDQKGSAIQSFCMIWRKVFVPIMLPLSGIAAVVLIWLGLKQVLSMCDWVVIFIPLYVMDFLIASAFIKSSDKGCWQRLLVAFLTWASGSTFLVLLALWLNDNINLPWSILFILMYANIVASISYPFYLIDNFSGCPCCPCCLSCGVMFSIAPTIAMTVLRLELVWTPSWPVCMIPLMSLKTIGTLSLIVVKVKKCV